MKKVLVLPVFFLFIFLTLAIFADFNVTETYPIGKNYIDSSNIYEREGYIYSEEPMLARPGTRYTFSIAKDYVDGAPFEVMINLMKDEQVLSRITRDERSMSFDIDKNLYYFTFMTRPDTTHFTLQLSDNGTYVEKEGLVNVQLEEGNVLTDYEPFEKEITVGSIIFYSVSLVVILGSLGIGLILYNNDKKKKVSKKKR